ncbi:gamma-glutamyltransferase 6 [Pelobates cultripes]|uniref:Gamma-glutamyltransferase 6 n=1 Tax=Pelobates cultripes TaxID=61616 RepID=A0AAD1SCP0_PELCU|nr:gamma-glutamyltransferase 6 [Pelobates cultripes]CAH2297403.1 gamma-glutamyltransferase 6 [Pelobates cultripes]
MAPLRQEVRYHKVQETESEDPEEVTVHLYSDSSLTIVRARYREARLRILSSVLFLVVAVAFIFYELKYGSLDSKPVSVRPPGSLEHLWNSSQWADVPPFYQNEEMSVEGQHHEDTETEQHNHHDKLNELDHHSHSHKEQPEMLPATHSHASGTYHNAAIVSDSETCSRVGKEVLASDGTLIDAGIATALCLAVVHPHTTSLGGIFSSIYYNGMASVLNAMPQEASQTKYGIPHLLQGLWSLHQKHGRNSWSQLVNYAVQLAKEGFLVDEVLAAALKEKHQTVKSSMELCNLFCESKNTLKGVGATVRNPTLGDVLQQIATSMTDHMLPTAVIQSLLHDLDARDKDTFSNAMSKIELKVEEPIELHFEGMTLYSTPDPTAGKILSDSLQETYNKSVLEGVRSDTSMYKAYHLLLNASIITYIKSGVRPRDSPTTIPTETLPPCSPAPVGSTILIASKNGSVFVMSLSLNSTFGSGFVSPSTGILMSDFACGSESLCPMFWASPSVLLGMEEESLGLGATGSSSIPFSLAQTIFSYVTLKKNLTESVHGTLLRYGNADSWHKYFGLVERKEELVNGEYPVSTIVVDVQAEHVHVATSHGPCCYYEGF